MNNKILDNQSIQYITSIQRITTSTHNSQFKHKTRQTKQRIELRVTPLKRSQYNQTKFFKSSLKCSMIWVESQLPTRNELNYSNYDTTKEKIWKKKLKMKKIDVGWMKRDGQKLPNLVPICSIYTLGSVDQVQLQLGPKKEPMEIKRYFPRAVQRCHAAARQNIRFRLVPSLHTTLVVLWAEFGKSVFQKSCSSFS